MLRARIKLAAAREIFMKRVLTLLMPGVLT
jgi:hypothetical protein